MLNFCLPALKFSSFDHPELIRARNGQTLVDEDKKDPKNFVKLVSAISGF